jgi:opacity protein-like surface antigen
MLKKFLSGLPAILLISLSIPALSQVEPAAGHPGGGLPVSVGIAYSNYMTDLNGGRLSGATVWSDWNFYKLPPLFDGFGIEVEGRDLNAHQPKNDPNLRMDTIAGGPIYTTHFYHRFHPYGKFLIGFGSVDFTSSNPNFHHDTRTMYVAGGGADTRVYKSIWLRVNYEYQFWPVFFHPYQTMNPSGIDVGFSYDFAHFR